MEKRLKPSAIGGQAVLEGIMMRCNDKYSVAVRKTDQTIAMEGCENYHGIGGGRAWTKLPLIRGVIAFVDSMVLGIKSLSYSAEFFDEEEDQDKKVEQPDYKKMDGEDEKKKESLGDKLLIALTIVFSVVASIGLFMILPYFIADFLLKQTLGWIQSNVAVTVVEAFVKIGIFLLYLWLVSLMQDIKRTYMYHGAEHKCINCLETGHALTVENVRQASRYHKRCGTSFLFLVMIISIAFFVCIRADYVLVQYLLRILLMPAIAGVSYEVIRFAGTHDGLFVDIISAPGKFMQKLTTREPDDSMIQVAIQAVEAVYDWKSYLNENGVEIDA